ncbi:hypothetical protein AJ88_19200 [Mesorhizobium amorphae CCBAU 01583]|nr:hypothetical protein AJ88_19200 [Mesorhizobium amorphae CCBAU 01583]
MSAEPEPVQYDQRWSWLKRVLAEPSLSAGTKVVLTVLFEAVDKKTGITKRYQEALAKDAGGMTVRGVQKCIEKAVAAGFIIVEHRGGGIVWDTLEMQMGSRVTIACPYPEPPFRVTLSLPRTAVADTPNRKVRQYELR